MITARVIPFRTLYNRPFTTSHGTRTGTDIIVLELKWKGFTGYGEASIPPYRKANPRVLVDMLSNLDLGDPEAGLNCLLDRSMDQLANEHEAQAACDIALHDLFAQVAGKSVRQFLKIDGQLNAKDMYTIATPDPKEVRQRIEEAPETDLFKVKLTGENDERILEEMNTFRDRPLFLDVNQGWNGADDFRNLSPLLEGSDVIGIEQPFPKEDFATQKQVRGLSSIPIYADESFETLDDLPQVADAFDGVNIKLMKCGGIRNGMRIIEPTRKSGLRIMLGSMSETTCGTAAAMQLAPLVDLLDQDGPWLLKNDPFEQVGGGGLGIKAKPELFSEI